MVRASSNKRAKLKTSGAEDAVAHPVVDIFAAARGLQTATWIFDIDNSKIIFANPPACMLWQAEDEEDLRSRDMGRDMSPTVAKRLRQYQTDFIDRNATFTEMWTLYPNGEPSSVMVQFRGFRLQDGRMAMQCEVFAQASDQPDNLRSAEALLHTDVMITLFPFEGAPLYMNPAARNLAHRPDAPLPEMFKNRHDLDSMMFELDRRGEHRQVVEVFTANGERWFDISSKSCSDAVTGKPAILVTAIDVSDLKQARDQARYLADRDKLTGCFNRSYLNQHMTTLKMTGKSRFALIYFDVDKFKTINDTYGHEAGDTILKAIAKRAQESMRAEELIVRLGGDEFVIVFKIEEGRDLSQARIDELLKVFSKPIKYGTSKISATVSMGICEFTANDFEVDTLLRNADTALYESKKNGRDQWTYFNTAMGEAAENRRKTESEIHQALKRREFILHYQPRVDLRTGEVVSVEGLARWQHPQKGLLSPYHFITICEETGMIDDLGQQVLEMGFEQARLWQERQINVRISLNISASQFSSDTLMKTLRNYSNSHEFEHSAIELELTESMLVGDREGLAKKLEKIVNLGYDIAIDDFGTGYSNLSYISHFPLKALKIDRSFITQLPKSGPIIQLIIALAKKIGATTVAEGVEYQWQYDWLSKQGCDQVQGYLVSKPLPVSEIEFKFDL